MKLYVSFRSDIEPPTKMASGNFNKLKKRMKDEGEEGAEYTVGLFDIKPNLENLCQAIEDVTQLPADEITEYVIKNGQLREA